MAILIQIVTQIVAPRLGLYNQPLPLGEASFRNTIKSFFPSKLLSFSLLSLSSLPSYSFCSSISPILTQFCSIRTARELPLSKRKKKTLCISCCLAEKLYVHEYGLSGWVAIFPLIIKWSTLHETFRTSLASTWFPFFWSCICH